ncbi:hypothetical protein GDO78_021845 [Eleutherodactylus coqui]|uniref:Uncharacterized protein n=1 Tax=Eleutherodactylus coqui TaxID=57060 RepID=A0A8J6BBB0_ELECQ|nr:hypothetical protein GDO78_021845 [Eleutherodactylus coqui]
MKVGAVEARRRRKQHRGPSLLRIGRRHGHVSVRSPDGAVVLAAALLCVMYSAGAVRSFTQRGLMASTGAAELVWD